ncbi:MAG: hypothetical protein LBD24_05715 [Spirochaetaceae bacterium]|jgi:hypothetical protein|nr:hypothetical protein [Spirochaetaceae bacterium]
MIRFVLVLCFALVSVGLHGQTRDGQTLGDTALAAKYVAWAEAALAENRWDQALTGLERGADFAAGSSDLAYLLALARSHENLPKGAVLEAARRALETDRWNTYSAVSCRLLKAEALLRIGRYDEALADLALVRPRTIDAFCLSLLGLKGLDDRAGFTKLLAEVMSAYPRDPRPVRIFFEYAADRLPLNNEGELMATALRRLPLLIESDRSLAYAGAPFIPDTDEARRILASYWAEGPVVPASVPAALNFGIIDGNDGIDELFKVSLGEEEKPLDKTLLLAVWNLLRDDAQRERFREKLARFSGVITEDENKDGYAEIRVFYREGVLTQYVYDRDQDGLPEWTVFFEAGVPVRMVSVSSPDTDGVRTRRTAAYPPVSQAERIMADVQWEQYPAVLETKLNGVVYTPKPFDFSFFPLYFKRLESGGILYPERNRLVTGIPRQTLASSSIMIERPSGEFRGGVERIELAGGVPQKAREFLRGRLVSETLFHQGAPVSQRVDLDGNGYLETARAFREPKRSGGAPAADDFLLKSAGIIAFSESDWDEDGIFEYAERYIYTNEGSGDFSSYTVVRFWDMDRDGVREFSDQIRYATKR